MNNMYCILCILYYLFCYNWKQGKYYWKICIFWKKHIHTRLKRVQSIIINNNNINELLEYTIQCKNQRISLRCGGNQGWADVMVVTTHPPKNKAPICILFIMIIWILKKDRSFRWRGEKWPQRMLVVVVDGCVMWYKNFLGGEVFVSCDV